MNNLTKILAGLAALNVTRGTLQDGVRNGVLQAFEDRDRQEAAGTAYQAGLELYHALCERVQSLGDPDAVALTSVELAEFRALSAGISQVGNQMDSEPGEQFKQLAKALKTKLKEHDEVVSGDVFLRFGIGGLRNNSVQYSAEMVTIAPVAPIVQQSVTPVAAPNTAVRPPDCEIATRYGRYLRVLLRLESDGFQNASEEISSTIRMLYSAVPGNLTLVYDFENKRLTRQWNGEECAINSAAAWAFAMDLERLMPALLASELGSNPRMSPALNETIDKLREVAAAARARARTIAESHYQGTLLR